MHPSHRILLRTPTKRSKQLVWRMVPCRIRRNEPSTIVTAKKIRTIAGAGEVVQVAYVCATVAAKKCRPKKSLMHSSEEACQVRVVQVCIFIQLASDLGCNFGPVGRSDVDPASRTKQQLGRDWECSCKCCLSFYSWYFRFCRSPIQRMTLHRDLAQARTNISV